MKNILISILFIVLFLSCIAGDDPADTGDNPNNIQDTTDVNDTINDSLTDTSDTNSDTVEVPVVTLLSAASVNVNDSLIIYADVKSQRVITRYVWAKDSAVFADTTNTCSLTVAYPDSGIRMLFVKAIDDTGNISLPDTCIITVTYDAPIIIKRQDTTLLEAGNFVIHVSAEDTNTSGSVSKYYWDTGADNWDDSTDVPEKTFSASGNDTLTVVWTARDNDGLFGATDTFLIILAAQPVSIHAGMVLIYAKDSSFQMGSNSGHANEQPVHTVSFTHDFWMDTIEVTQGDFKALIGNNYSMFLGDNRPADVIGFKDAARYCNARSRRDGLEEVYDTITWSRDALDLGLFGYRLPTESEWEYACKAGTTGNTFWENGSIDEYAWYKGNRGTMTTFIVAQKKPNPWGLYDICGNVWELCNDLYTTYSAEQQVDPLIRTGIFVVHRGGSIDSNEGYVSSIAREDPSMPGADKDSGRAGFGFRVILPVK